MKRLVSILLVAVLFISSIPLQKVEAAGAMFKDVKSSDWYYKEVNYLKGKNVLDAKTGTSFKPNDKITRVEAAKMVVKAAGIPTTKLTATFKDVKKTHKDYKYIAAAQQALLVTRDSKGNFNPNGTFTRVDVAKAIVRAFELKGSYSRTFKDVPKTHWAKSLISTAVANEVLNGYRDGSFNPYGKVTRAEMATYVYNAKVGSPFKQKGLDNYSSTDQYQVKDGTLYLKSGGKFIKPSEKYIANYEMLNVIKSFLNKDRYTLVSPDKNSISITTAVSEQAASYGLAPISYVFFVNNKQTRSGVKNIRFEIILDYTFYDSKAKQWNYYLYRNQLKDSLVKLFGGTDGTKMYDFIYSTKQKYSKKIPNDNQSFKSTKQFGKVKVTTNATSDDFYVYFSY